MTASGELPAGWVRARLDEVTDVRLGRQRSPQNHTGKQMRPYLRAANVTWAGLDLSDVKSMNFTDDEVTTYRLRPGDVLLSEASGSAEEVGKPAIWRDDRPGPVCFQNTLLRVRPEDGVLPEYLHLRLLHEAVSGGFARSSRGVGIHHLGAAKLAALQVEIPPTEEQRRIVAVLDNYLVYLNAAAAGISTLQHRLAHLERALVDAAVAGPAADPAEAPPGVRALQSRVALRAGWSWKSIAELLIRIEAGRSPRCEPRPARIDERGVIKVSSMTYGEFDALENKALLAGATYDTAHEIRNGDLLLSRANTSDYVGAVVRVPEGTRPGLLLSDKSLRLVPAGGVNAAWLMYALRSGVARQQIERAATGTKESMRNISQDKLRRIYLPVPPTEAEQEGIVHELRLQLGFVGSACTGLDALRQKVGVLRRSLLQMAFTGQLVEQDPADEPADLLLKRIAEERAAAAPTARRRRARTVTTTGPAATLEEHA